MKLVDTRTNGTLELPPSGDTVAILIPSHRIAALFPSKFGMLKVGWKTSASL